MESDMPGRRPPSDDASDNPDATARPSSGRRKTPKQSNADQLGAQRPDPLLSRPFGSALDLDNVDDETLRKMSPEEVRQVDDSRIADVTHFRVGLDSIRFHTKTARDLAANVRRLPRSVRGRLLDGKRKALVSVSVQLAVPPNSQANRSGAEESKPRLLGRAVITDEAGIFELSLLEISDDNRRLLMTEGLGLFVTGANSMTELLTPSLPTAGQQALGELTLKQALKPIPRSIIGALVDLVDQLPSATTSTGFSDGTQPPVKVRIGQDACNIEFEEDAHLRRFPYRVLVRLIEPRTTTVTRVKVQAEPIGPGTESHAALNVWEVGERDPQPTSANSSPSSLPTLTYFDRVPVGRPISVDGFRDQVIGVTNNTIGKQRTVPMAGTLGLGYVINLAQVWKYDGLTLGNLLYSLPLAPGEQQRIAVSERRASASVMDRESLTMAEQQEAWLREDSSTSAVFQSAFSERLRTSASSSGRSGSRGAGIGAAIGAVAGGVALGFVTGGAGIVAGATAGGAIGASVGAGIGGVNSSGTSNSSLDGARSFTASAAEEMNRSVEQQASARRSATRSAIRLATAAESESVTTKVITNHNKLHALTVQYWEVLRKFVSTTDVEGCTLVCFVPLDLIRFLPPDQPLALIDENAVDSRDKAVRRYAMIQRHADAIRPYLPPRHQAGLRLLEDFAANTRSKVDLDRASSNTLNFTLDGTWLPFERVRIHVILRDGRRLGPIQLVAATATLKQSEYGTRTELLAELARRRSEDSTSMTGKLQLPQSVAPDDVIAFEINRSFETLNYQFDLEKIPEYVALKYYAKLSGINLDLSRFESSARLRSSELEEALHGPLVQNFSATLNGLSDELAADRISERHEFPPSGIAIPAVEYYPVIGYRDIMKIERMLQHVVRNTLTYSTAVWASLTAEERAVMLEGFTIGLPGKGIKIDKLNDPSQHVPLLNCVANQLLGFYGNCMIMPFSIPPTLAVLLNQEKDRNDGNGQGGSQDGDDSKPLTTAAVQDALSEFHRQAFSPLESRFTLPTQGVLGEAVLGQCPSAEKIDLTRFWNWQDSPGAEATAIDDVKLRGTGVDGLTAPDSLKTIPQIVNNVADGSASAALAQALAAKSPGGVPFAPELLGKTIDSAEAARKDSLAAYTGLTSQAMNTGLELFKAQQSADKSKADSAKGNAVDSAVKNLKDNAPSYLLATAASGSPQAAGVFAAAKILTLTGGVELPKDKAETLRAAYEKKENGQLTDASTAWLTALKLLQ
jgi:hypothetical protein